MKRVDRFAGGTSPVRDHWAGLLLLCSLFIITAGSPVRAAESPFSFDRVVEQARTLAVSPFQDPRGNVPQFLLDMSYDQWRDIRFRPGKALWKDEKFPFSLQFFHVGLYYDRSVVLNIVEEGVPAPIAFSPDYFDYGQNTFASQISSELGFAGFRIHYPVNRPDYADELAVFLGASYLRAVGRDQHYGLSARGLSVDTAMPEGEEFPWFREFWIVKPAADAAEIVVYALLDSPSVTGAYRYRIVSDEETRMEVNSVLFTRHGGHKIGVAPLTSMYFFGESENGYPGDFRPEVHDSDGLTIRMDNGEWLWRPLKNPGRLGISAFQAVDPRGFGLFQRDLNFDHYQDLEARYAKRPSLWVQPMGDWGAGHVELVEIPTDSEVNDNIVAFWVPRDMPEPGEPAVFNYVLNWRGSPKDQPPLGRAAATRLAGTKGQGVRKIIVDFEGGELAGLDHDAGLVSVVTVGEGGRLLEKQLMKNPLTGGWRLTFLVEPEAGHLKGVFPLGRPPVELRVFLKKGENLSDVLTETWSYSLNF